jgi:hypothetical protein
MLTEKEEIGIGKYNDSLIIDEKKFSIEVL